MKVKIFGIENTVYFAPSNPSMVRAYLSRDERDKAIISLRRRAIAEGLMESSATAGIRPVQFSVDDNSCVIDEIKSDPGVVVDAEEIS